ncbi:MAG TPA: phage shock protein PspA [Alphaproteobacteria bacterium]|nr:phage shock protein PspA [Alphaproteobacteria bacterium]
MGIFSRLADIVNANLTALLDRAEDPEKMLRLMIQEMEDTLVEVRSSAVRILADRKEVQRKADGLRAAAEDWQAKAELAVSKGRDDLAKGALLARAELLEEAKALEGQLAAIAESIAKHDDDLAKLEAKLAEAKAKQKTFAIRVTAAQQRVQMRRHVADGRIDDVIARFDRMERKLDDLESQAESFDLGKRAGLAQDFAALEADSRIEAELAALKARVGSGKTE